MPTITILVRNDRRGRWQVGLSDRPRTPIACDTLDEARRVARRFAAGKQPCDLVVRDAYDRVLEHELIGAPDE